MRISDWSSDVCSSDLLRRGQDDRHAVLRLEDFTVEDDVRPIALDPDLVALLEMHACELLLPQCPAPRRAQHPEQCADVAVGREIGRAHSELQSLMRISYAVFCLKKKKQNKL